ncbi:MAG: type III secretion protein [Puniceicoccales bacterium]|jgi:chromosome segregation ATPase|nr:type III secretion protein [Puniceicoccales bacterium]
MAAKYALGDLLKVRHIRKDRAEKEVVQARRLLVAAQKILQKALQELEDYRVFVQEETEHLYAAIIKQSVRRRNIDDLHETVRALRASLLEHERRVENAQEECRKAEEHIEQCKETLATAKRNIEKIEAHKETWIAEVIKEEEFQADLEMEDFRVKK